MAAPGVPSGGLYGWLYRFANNLSPVAKQILSRAEGKLPNEEKRNLI
jgi:hypothetical protein